MLNCRYVVSTLLLVLGAQTGFAQAPHWVQMNPPPVGSKKFSVDANDSLLFAATDSDIHVTSNNGNSWEKLADLHGNLPIQQFWTSGPFLYATTGINHITDANTLNRSSDNGKSWDSLDDGAGTHYKSDNCMIFIGVFDYNGFSYSSDNGITWSSITSNSFDGKNANFEMWSPHFIICYIDTMGHFLHSQLSSDSGKTWKIIPDAPGGFDYDGTSFFSCSKDGVFESTDTCQTWHLISTDISKASIKISGKIMYALSLEGIYYSINRGRNWRPMNDGLTNLNIKDFLVTNDELYTRLKTGELFHTGFPSAVISNNTKMLCLSASPNPATNESLLSYSLPASSDVSIQISDALGRVISQPLSAVFQDKGDHSITVSLTDIPKGMYYCLIHTATEEATAKLIVVK